MHKTVPEVTHNSALHFAYTAYKFLLLIGLENSRDQCFKTSRAKTAELRSLDQDHSLEDYKTVNSKQRGSLVSSSRQMLSDH